MNEFVPYPGYDEQFLKLYNSRGEGFQFVPSYREHVIQNLQEMSLFLSVFCLAAIVGSFFYSQAQKSGFKIWKAVGFLCYLIAAVFMLLAAYPLVRILFPNLSPDEANSVASSILVFISVIGLICMSVINSRKQSSSSTTKDRSSN